MPIQIIISNSLWDDKTHQAEVFATDLLEAHVRFDQPINHELEYIENDVTRFFLDLSTNGTPISRLSANKVLQEMMTEARDFRNGRFRFPICKMPDALTPSYHAAFAKTMATMPAGTHIIDVFFTTDNPLQEGKILAQTSFTFVLADTDKTYLEQVAQENIKMGADQEEDPQAKAAFYQKLNQSSEKIEAAQVTFINKSSADIELMAGYNSGQKLFVPYQSQITVNLAAGTEIYRFDGQACTTKYGSVNYKHTQQQFDVY